MEAKTMGSFIAALRKANGMTQKDLAEKLNVSDKSVSRWERDEGAPDLSLIPVIAEVFGITCDELLRGERKPESQRQESAAEEPLTPKADKQRQRLLKASITKYRSRMLIAAAIACLGLIAAMICNFAFQRASLGFFIALIFYLAGGVCLAVFMNNALFAVSDEEEDADVLQYKKQVRSLFGMGMGLLAGLLLATLPLVLLVEDAYWGLGAGSWLATALGFLLLGAVVFLIARHLLEGRRIAGSENASPAAIKNWRLKSIVGLCCAGVLLITFACSAVMLDLDRLGEAQGEVFTDFASFKAFMETDASSFQYDGAMYTAVTELTYDENGEPVTLPEDEYMMDEVRLSDGTPEGRLLGTFQWKNQTVQHYSVEEAGEGNLRFTVVTDHAWRDAKAAQQNGFVFCALLCLLEVAAALLIYKKLKTR